MSDVVPTVTAVASQRRPSVSVHQPGAPVQLVAAVRTLTQDLTADWVVVEVPLVAGASNRVAHGLGRVPTGWTVIDLNAPATTYQVTGDLDDRAHYLILATTANVTVRLFVF